MVVHYKRKDEENEEDLGCLLYVAIVDDKAHNASTMFAILQHCIHILKKSQAPAIFIVLQIRQRVSIAISSSRPAADWLFVEANHDNVHVMEWAASQKGGR